MKKFFMALILVGNLFFASIADAEIKIYTATGNDSPNKLESQEIVKLRALDKAIKLASEQAAVDFKNFGLRDEEISVIIANGYELGEISYTQANLSWQATIELKIDDSEVKNWIRRDDREKFVFLNQNREMQRLSEINSEKLEKLRERAENMNKQDKKFFKDEFNYLNNEFLSNRKVLEGNKFFWRGRLDDAINLYKEAISLNEYNASAYNWRGNLYNSLAEGQKVISIAESNRRQAINDFEMAIRLNQNYSEAFGNRGLAYYGAKNFSAAIKDFSRAIQLEPTISQNYVYRAQCYRQTDKNLALNDFNKAVELESGASYVFFNRGSFFEQDLKDFSKALEDYTRAIELERRESTLPIYFNNRGSVYQKMKLYGKAIDDYTRAIEISERLEQKNPLLAWIYRKRGECYQILGDNTRSQADLKKFGELQRR